MEMVTNAINWFEIPVDDFDRAAEFYNKIFNYEMPPRDWRFADGISTF
jgi:predicted enzyme related to lactoylglutathione lyase